MSSARITFYGAAGEVTGSSYLIETGGSKVLVDCGMYQGADADWRNSAPFAFRPSDIDAVVLTHAHIDHSGRVPLLVKGGFKGGIWATDPTIDLAAVLLRDTAKLMAEEAEWRTRKNSRKGLPPVKPAYAERDVEETIGRFKYIGYDDQVGIAPGVTLRFRDAGHIIGAAMVELWLAGEDSGRPVKIVFSGDTGPRDSVVGRPPSIIEEADYVVIESTYGDRSHRSLEETRQEFRRELGGAIETRGKILIPTFVVDRAQRVLYEILRLQRSDGFPRTPPIYFDSPMGERATKIYEKYTPLLSREMQEYVRVGQNPFSPDGLKYTSGVEESRAINGMDHAIVLAGSGMCNGGRILHHLKHNLWSKNCSVFFVGYQARGTLGRRLVDGDKHVRIAGEDIAVGARLHTLGGFSAHADRGDLLAWAGSFRQGAVFFVTHGEPRSSEALASGIRNLGFRAAVPSLGTSYDVDRRDGVVLSSEGEPARRDAADRAAVMELLREISSEAESLRESISEWSDPSAAVPLLESTRLILRSARNMKQ
ncbi:MAG: MBL fold metallo-hydrolase [Synergistaceae bacterium]|nr:MBL fold metallo-hydrolase [Synergistaceae bacterium]